MAWMSAWQFLAQELVLGALANDDGCDQCHDSSVGVGQWCGGNLGGGQGDVLEMSLFSLKISARNDNGGFEGGWLFWSNLPILLPVNQGHVKQRIWEALFGCGPRGQN